MGAKKASIGDPQICKYVYTQLSGMVTKTINIRESAYIALTRNKRSGESYSDVILRITVKREKMSGIF